MSVIRTNWGEYIDGRLSNVTCAEAGGVQIDQPTQDNRRSKNVQIFYELNNSYISERLNRGSRLSRNISLQCNLEKTRTVYLTLHNSRKHKGKSGVSHRCVRFGWELKIINIFFFNFNVSPRIFSIQ